MATIRWCPIYPKWDICQSLSLKPPKHQAFFMTEVLRSPSMSTIGGFINSAVMRCSERGQPRNGGSCVHIKRYSYAIRISVHGLCLRSFQENSMEFHHQMRSRQDVRNQLVLETQHAGRWKLPSTAAVFRDEITAERTLHAVKLKSWQRKTCETHHKRCMCSMVHAKERLPTWTVAKKTTSNPLRVNLSRTRFNHANCHVCIPQIGKYIVAISVRFCSWNIIIFNSWTISGSCSVATLW